MNFDDPGMVLKLGTNVLLPVVGSDLLSSCLTAINLAGGNYSSYLDACNNGPTDPTTTYYQTAAGPCASGYAWKDIDMNELINTSLQAIFYQGPAECAGSGNGVAREYNYNGMVVGNSNCP